MYDLYIYKKGYIWNKMIRQNCSNMPQMSTKWWLTSMKTHFLVVELMLNNIFCLNIVCVSPPPHKNFLKNKDIFQRFSYITIRELYLGLSLIFHQIAGTIVWHCGHMCAGIDMQKNIHFVEYYMSSIIHRRFKLL